MPSTLNYEEVQRKGFALRWQHIRRHYLSEKQLVHGPAQGHQREGFQRDHSVRDLPSDTSAFVFGSKTHTRWVYDAALFGPGLWVCAYHRWFGSGYLSGFALLAEK
jgi:hypothetical protein